MVAHVLGKSDLEEWCDLCICNLRERLENLCWRANFLHMRILWVFLLGAYCVMFFIMFVGPFLCILVGA